MNKEFLSKFQNDILVIQNFILSFNELRDNVIKAKEN